MNKISPIHLRTPDASSAVSSGRSPAAGQAKTPAEAKVHKAAQDFEGMFLKQILSAAKVGGSHGKQNGYDGMAVDAVADAVGKGGGMGLARQIEDAVAKASLHNGKK